ncbi:MAG: ScyD/ScyE family protein, partial [Ilumatobacteraceae bacterium]
MSASADDDHGDESSAKVLLDGLNSPKGLALNTDRDLVIAQGAFGPPDPVLVYDLRGANKGAVTPVTAPASLMDVAISPLDGTGWAIVAAVEDPPSPALLVHQLADGTVVTVLDIFAYQGGDPDPVDQDDFDTESNPYGLTIDKNGDALFTDAANNDLVRVTPDGIATTVARFDLEAISTDHLPGFPVPTLTAEAVPTTVTVGPNGDLFVGELKGFPFRPGSSNIWRIES